MCTAFFGCLRSGELCITDNCAFNPNVHLCVEDMVLDEANKRFTLYLKSSKTDAFRHGVSVMIGCSKKETCAFCFMKRYIDTSPRSPRDALFINAIGQPLTKSYFVANTRMGLSLLGVNPANYAGHSYRAGAAKGESLMKKQTISDQNCSYCYFNVD